MVVLTIMTAAFVPIVGERVRMAQIRTMVGQFAFDVRAARWTAVSLRSPVDLTVSVEPTNVYQFLDSRGRPRRVEMPEGVRIVSSTSPIRFEANGSVPGGASTVIEVQLDNDTVSRWTVSTNLLGVPTTTEEKVHL
jgi:Tfp pilus assembly protein FimT